MPISTEKWFFPKQDLSRLAGKAIMKKQLMYTNICLARLPLPLQTALLLI